MKWWLVLQFSVLKVLGLILIFGTDWTLVGFSIFLTGGLFVVAHHFLPRSQGLCDVVTGFNPERRELWLTIDDGPNPVDTPQILDLLDEHNAKATFFMIGARAEKHPELVCEVISRGHTVGNHTYSHPLKDLWFAGRNRVNHEVKSAQQILQKAGAEVRFFRSPAGIKNVFMQRCLTECGLRSVAWTTRSGDTFGSKKDDVIKHVLSKAQPGAIILMHEGETVEKAVRVEALRGVLKGLSERGFSCVIPNEDSLLTS